MLMQYHLWDVVVPVSLTVLLLVLVFTIAVCKYKRCMNMGKDVALRRHRKLWMTCGSLGSDFPSRSTTEQSLYYHPTEEQPPRSPTLLADACVQTSQIIYPQEMLCKKATATASPKHMDKQQFKSGNYLEAGASVQQQHYTPVTLSFNTIMPSCYPEKCSIADTTKQSPMKIASTNTITDDNVLHLKDIASNCKDKNMNSPSHWQDSLVDRGDDEGASLLSSAKQLSEPPLVDLDMFYPHTSTELLLPHK